MSRKKISCFVIACNEEDRIENCLKPLAGWVDELIVLDSGSTDDTVEIARRYCDKVYQTDWPGFGAQRNRALSYCQHEWVLNIDADEVVTDALKSEINDLLSLDRIPANLIKIPWRTVLFGKALRYGRYWSPQGKLFLQTNAKFKDRAVHETLILPNERAVTLKSPLIHYSWRSYQHMQAKHLQYACLLAEQKFKKGKRSNLFFAIFRFASDFIQQYVFRLGFLDGWRGLLMAIVLGQYAFHKYAALFALQLSEAQNNTKKTGTPKH